MTKPDNIQQDIWQIAQNIVDQACMPEHYYKNGVVTAVQVDIARALMAERERCANIVATAPLSNRSSEPATSNKIMADRIEAAIRRGDA
jgi:hypothetical protein